MYLRMLIFREFKRRPGRSLLTVLSVAIGVAAVVSVATVSTMTRRAFSEMYESIAGRPTLEVIADGGGDFAEEVATLVRRCPGVAAALPAVERHTVVYSSGRRIRVLGLGIDPALERALGDYVLEKGEFLRREGECLLVADLARGLDIDVGDEIKILTRRGVRRLRLSGLLATRGAPVFRHGAMLLMSLGDAQRLLAKPQRVDAIHLVLDGSRAEQAVLADVARRLPPGLSVRRPGERTELLKSTLRLTEQALGCAGGLSLALATAVILNTFLMSLSERRRELGILRAVGATRRQIMALLISEGLVVAGAGVSLGLVLGFGGAHWLSRAMENLLLATLPDGQVALGPGLLAVALGSTVSLLAVYLPARKAGLVSPMEAVRDAVSEAPEGIVYTPALVAAATVLLAGAGIVAAATGLAPMRVMVPAQIIALAGLAISFPALIGPLSRCACLALLPFLRVQGWLARLQIMRHRMRTALTASVLLVAMSFAVSIGNTAINTMEDVASWFKRAATGDFYIWATLPDVATGLAMEMPETLRQEIGKMPGIKSLDTVRYLGSRVAGQPVIVAAREFTRRDRLPLDLYDGRPDEVRKGLFEGEAVIGTVLAERASLGRGSRFVLDSPGGPHWLRVAGIANEYYAGGMTIHLERTTAERFLQVEGVDVFVIESLPAARRDVEASLRAFCESRGLLLQSEGDLQELLDQMSAGFVASLWVLLVLGLIVGALGILNTLMMNVLEQGRELGLLRVVGMTRGQLRKAVLAQAAIMAAMGLVPGALAGAGLSWVNGLCAVRLMGHPIGSALDPVWLAECLAVAFLVVMAAAWIPAEHAARLDLEGALRHE